ncbi:MAG: EamA family transporter [Anaerolineae bacterium]|nr:MAG: EamA family transporter [Anaerolineae bacterium]
MTQHTRGLLAGLTAAAIWGGLYVISKVVLDVLPPFVLLTLRLLLGIAALGVALRLRGGGLGIARKDLPEVLALGLLGYGVSLGLQFVGTRLSTAANGAVITSATPAFVFLFARLILGERVSGRRIAALVVSTIGVLAVLDVGAARLAPDLFWGNLALAGAGITWAWYSVLVRKATRRLDTLPVSLLAFAGGLAIAVPGAAWELSRAPIGPVSLPTVLGVLYIGLISTAVAAYLWNKAFELVEAGVASLTFFAQPVVGALLGVWLLGELATPGLLLGGALIGLGLWLASRPERDRAGVKSYRGKTP